MSSFTKHWLEQKQARQKAGLWRTHRRLSSPQEPKAIVDGRELIVFCSNDYLGLANHPEVKAAAIESIQNDGVGGGASHLVIGHHDQHALLEEELAAFTGRERALVFSSGYMANLGVISALVSKGDTVLEDRLNHASLIDGGLLSGARFQRYLHNDMSSLASRLEASREKGKTLVVTDGVFSMDGDVAELSSIAELCKQEGALLLVDDAHGFGVLGEKGAGTVSEQGLSQTDVPVLIGTFGKAFGTAGAFVAGSADLIDYLVQSARPYIYTTSMPPSIAAATRASLKLIQSSDDRRERVRALIKQFRKGVDHIGLDLMDSQTPIQPILIGDSHKALGLSKFLEDNGVLVSAIRPPTVPENTARLRVTLTANHTPEQVECLYHPFPSPSPSLS